MIQALTFEEFQLHAKKEKYVAVFREISANLTTPTLIYTLLKKQYNADGVMLENLRQQELSRYSFICFDPISTFFVKDRENIDLLNALREFRKNQTCSTRSEVAELITTSVGLMTYDAVRYFEIIPDRHEYDSSMPDALFHFYKLSLAYDHDKKTILISVLVNSDDPSEARYKKAQEEIQHIIDIISTSEPESESEPEVMIHQKMMAEIQVDMSDADYMNRVNKAKDYIVRGEAFQIVLSRCFKRNYSVNPFIIYKTLRQVSPAPFMVYFPTESSVIMGASPERLVRIHNDKITVNPIAGTRKRLFEKTEAMISEDLLSDKKEVAEHMMLVDLARSDVGAVSEPGSVQVTESLRVKHYSHVSHITSTITGKLDKKYDALDAFSSAFPAGTLSGAPKIRAMQIIDELEDSRRGLYGGAICRFDASENLESCIAIRMAVLQQGIATIRTGAGIVYDSNPENEAKETCQKAQSMLDAIAKAQGETTCY